VGGHRKPRRPPAAGPEDFRRRRHRCRPQADRPGRRADLVLDEITPHARAACELKPDVDTIIEIGGQDSKFTTLKDGRVNFCRHEHGLCGRHGSFIEEQARNWVPAGRIRAGRLELPLPMASDRCTVFMERTSTTFFSRGILPRDPGHRAAQHRGELPQQVARRKAHRSVICSREPPPKNKALVAAFEQRLGKPIHVSRFCHLTGAIGAALVRGRRRKLQHAFQGLDLCRRNIPTQVEICSLCANHCKITVAMSAANVWPAVLCGRTTTPHRGSTATGPVSACSRSANGPWQCRRPGRC